MKYRTLTSFLSITLNLGSMVEWLKCRAYECFPFPRSLISFSRALTEEDGESSSKTILKKQKDLKALE